MSSHYYNLKGSIKVLQAQFMEQPNFFKAFFELELRIFQEFINSFSGLDPYNLYIWLVASQQKSYICTQFIQVLLWCNLYKYSVLFHSGGTYWNRNLAVFSHKLEWLTVCLVYIFIWYYNRISQLALDFFWNVGGNSNRFFPLSLDLLMNKASKREKPILFLRL